MTPIPIEAQRGYVSELSSETLDPKSITTGASDSFFLFITCDPLEPLVAQWVKRHPWLAKLKDSGGRTPVAVASPAIKVGRDMMADDASVGRTVTNTAVSSEEGTNPDM